MSFLLFFFSSSMVNVVVLVLVVKGSGHLSDKYPQRFHYRFLTCKILCRLVLRPLSLLVPHFFFLFVCLRHFEGKNHSFCRYFFWHLFTDLTTKKCFEAKITLELNKTSQR